MLLSKIWRALSVKALAPHFWSTVGSRIPWFTKYVKMRSSNSNWSGNDKLLMTDARIVPMFKLYVYQNMNVSCAVHNAQPVISYLDETLVIDGGKYAHQELAIKPIGQPTVSWDTLTEILNVECTLDTTSKETAKWSNQWGKTCHHEWMKLNRCNPNLRHFLVNLLLRLESNAFTTSSVTNLPMSW